MTNDVKTTILGTVQRLAGLGGLFGLPQISPEQQMAVAQIIFGGYLVIGIFKDLYTNKPDDKPLLAEAIDKLAEVLKKT